MISSDDAESLSCSYMIASVGVLRDGVATTMKICTYKLLLKLAQRILNLLVQAWEHSLSLLNCLLLQTRVSIRELNHDEESSKQYFLDSQTTHLLSQNEVGILIIGSLAGFELSDLDILLLELLVVTAFLFDQTVEHRGGDCELRGSWHCGFARSI